VPAQCRFQPPLLPPAFHRASSACDFFRDPRARPGRPRPASHAGVWLGSMRLAPCRRHAAGARAPSASGFFLRAFARGVSPPVRRRKRLSTAPPCKRVGSEPSSARGPPTCGRPSTRSLIRGGNFVGKSMATRQMGR
jgi:hypothetical protein